jgi:hypothetical protein
MRYIEPLPPKHGDQKLKSWFAFRKVKIGREERWLEFVDVVFEYREYIKHSPRINLPFGMYLAEVNEPFGRWEAIRFLDTTTTVRNKS